MTARLVTLEGIDQSGKKTQTRLLIRRLRLEGFKVDTLSFPIYQTPSGREIRASLKGRRSYPLQALHMLYSLNRWENKEAITQRLKQLDFLVVDRYSPSNLAYGSARGLDLNWLKTLDEGLPRPDRVVLIDVPVPTSFARKKKGRDIHENDSKLLLKVRRNYLKLAKIQGWRVVNGTGPARRVHQEVWKHVQDLI